MGRRFRDGGREICDLSLRVFSRSSAVHAAIQGSFGGKLEVWLSDDNFRAEMTSQDRHRRAGRDASALRLSRIRMRVVAAERP
jgi:hypothetical protein